MPYQRLVYDPLALIQYNFPFFPSQELLYKYYQLFINLATEEVTESSSLVHSSRHQFTSGQPKQTLADSFRREEGIVDEYVSQVVQ